MSLLVPRTSRDRWLRVAALAALVLAAAVVPLPAREEPAFGPLGPDKLLHLGAHAALAFALADAIDGRPAAAIVVGAAASTLYGAGTELLQLGVAGRSYETADIAANATGAALGAAAWRLRSRGGDADP